MKVKIFQTQLNDGNILEEKIREWLLRTEEIDIKHFFQCTAGNNLVTTIIYD